MCNLYVICYTASTILIFFRYMCLCPHSPSLHIPMAVKHPECYKIKHWKMSKHQKGRFLCNHNFIQNHTDWSWKVKGAPRDHLVQSTCSGTGKAGHSRTCPAGGSISPWMETQPPLWANCSCIQPPSHSSFQLLWFSSHPHLVFS